MSRTLELPEAVYAGLLEAAKASGVSPAEWIAAKLPSSPAEPATDETVRIARERLWRHVVSLGHPTGGDNDEIDADLARAYLDPHEDEPAGDPRR